MSNAVSTLNVLLYGKLIGTITHVGADRTLFAFAQDYIEDEQRPILSLGFKDSLGELLSEFRTYRTRLMPFFSNLLPEERMRVYLAGRAGVSPEREFFLLWVLGRDLPGAVTIEPAAGEALPPRSQTLLEASHLQDDKPLRFSLAGVQLKFSAVGQARGGLAIPVDGAGGSWIVKLPSGQYKNVPENEYSMMSLASRIGIDVPETKLFALDDIENIPSGIEQFGTRVFAIRRFDRDDDGSAIHIEDFAQVFGEYPENKYIKASMRNIANVINIEGQESDISEFIRRLVFNSLIGNADMHLKNWSVIYRDPYTPAIAPAYDFVSTILYLPDENAALKVSRSKRFDAFNLEELSHLAAKARLPEKLVQDTAIETVRKFLEVWNMDKKHLELSVDMIKVIERHMKTIPIIEEAG